MRERRQRMAVLDFISIQMAWSLPVSGTISPAFIVRSSVRRTVAGGRVDARSIEAGCRK
jgi:hypothetical protein